MFTRFFSVFSKFKALKTHGRLLWHAFRHAETPRWIKGFMLAVVAYLFSPIDLVPDFLVLLGITDDLVVISGAMWFLGKVIPDNVRRSLPEQPDSLPLRTRRHSRLLKTLGIVLLLGVLLASLVNHPGVQSWLSAI
ncbi:MAG TPA: DUF1232 domain-containing protein [Limnobacter sp.]|nr:DUF1232 domain-containing protein [Limnobacter sp.]